MPYPPRVTAGAVSLGIAALSLGVGALLAGCGSPTTGAKTTAPAPLTLATSRPPTTAPPRTSGPSPTGTPTFAEAIAVPCRGYPSADQVIGYLRRTSSILPTGVTLTVSTGPLCAGTWQYTVITAPNQDPLQVITRGAPATLQLVTAGTDVCSVSVRATAPAGIRTAAHC